MDAVRRLFWLLLILSVALVLALAGFYLKISSDLPEMQTEGQVVGLVGRSVEAYRGQRANETGGKVQPFAVVPREALRAPLGLALLAVLGCPGYLDAAPVGELGFWREQLAPAGGAAGCAARMGGDLAARLLLPTAQHTTVAADRIRGLLGRDGLFALWASALPFAPDGPEGVEPASRHLFREAPQALDWERAAELVVATGLYDEVATCKNPAHLREMRDKFLTHAADLMPAQAHEIIQGAKAPLACEHLRR